MGVLGKKGLTVLYCLLILGNVTGFNSMFVFAGENGCKLSHDCVTIRVVLTSFRI